MTIEKEATAQAIKELSESKGKIQTERDELRIQLAEARHQINDAEGKEKERVADLYTKSNGQFQPRPSVIIDPVYQSITIDEKFATILKHPLVQRLDSIRQLPFATITNPNACHTRLSHSLGVARLAEYAMQQLLTRNKIYIIGTDKSADFPASPKDREDLIFLAKVCGLLHDVGHAAFGHTLDRVVHQKVRETRVGGQRADKYFSAQIVRHELAKVLGEVGIDPEVVVSIFCPSMKPPPKPKASNLTPYLQIVKSIIDSDLDADRMDYMTRDSTTSGLLFGVVDWDTIIRGMRAIRTKSGVNTVVFDEEIRDHLEQAVFGRLAMYGNFYESPAKISCETMLQNCVDFFLVGRPQEEILDLVKFGDEDLLSHIMRFSASDSPAYLLAKLLKLRRSFTEIFAMSANPEGREGGRICKKIDDYMESLRRAENPFLRPLEWRGDIIGGLLDERQAWNVLVYTTPKDRLEQSAEVDIYLLHKNGGVWRTSRISDPPWVAGVIRNYAMGMAKVRVFANQELGAETLRELHSRCEKYFELGPALKPKPSAVPT